MLLKSQYGPQILLKIFFFLFPDDIKLLYANENPKSREITVNSELLKGKVRSGKSF